MATKGKILRNRKTGQTLEFVVTDKDSSGRLLEMIASYAPGSKEPPAHYHPFQDEQFDIIEGEMMIRMNQEVIIRGGGESVIIPRNAVHGMWNNGKTSATVRWSVTPALKTEYLLETLVELSNTGKTNEQGRPTFIKIVLLALRYKREFRLARRPGS